MTVITTETLLRVYKAVRVVKPKKKKVEYKPSRTHYNAHLFG